MIYKLKNGGIAKLKNKGKVPEYGDVEKIAAYNREHGTNFYKMSQVIEHDKQQAQKKSQDKKKTIWNVLATGVPESAGEAILNKTIETANNAELPETRKSVYKDTGKKQLATTAGSLLTLPMLGEFSTYGLLGGASRLAGGMTGSAVGSYALGKAGELGDHTFGTTWIKPVGQIIGGFAGWVPGSNIAYKGALNLASSTPKIAKIGATKQFVGDVAGRALGRSVSSTSFIPAQVKYYGPTMGKSYAAKTNPNLIDLDTWGRPEYDQLAKKYGYKDWREMILSDKGDYNEEYKQLIKDQIRRIQSNPQYSGKTIVVSNASLLKPNSGITFANTPVIPERSVMATRNNTRHPWESIAHGEEWWDSLQRKGTPLRIDNRFVSELEGNKVIPFTKFHFDPRVKPLSRPISEAERLGISKGERSNPKVLEDPQYWGYQQWNSRYNAAVESGNIEEAQRLRDLHFRLHAKNNVIIDGSGMPVKVYHGSPENFNIFDYTRTAKYPEGHFFFGEDFDYVHSHARRRAFGKDYNVKSYYLYDTEKYPINKNKVDPKIVPIVTDRQGYPLETELYSDLASYIRTRFQNKPHIIYGYDAGRDYIPGKYDYAVPFNTQMKLTDPITYNKREIIPIVKRDNFRNPDIRYKQGGILKVRNDTIVVND